MIEQLNRLFESPLVAGVGDLESIVLCLLLAFVLGQLIAWVYGWTHSGLSYSRTFVQSIVLLTIIVALVMVVIGNNIVTAFGLIGALAIIRFRNVLKDTRDTVFIFAGLVVGMGVGSQRFAAATLGTLVICAIMVYLHLTRFGTKHHGDGLLRFRVKQDVKAEETLRNVLNRHCRRLKLVSMRAPGPTQPAEFAYEVALRDRQRNAELVQELGGVAGVRDISFALQEELQEI